MFRLLRLLTLAWLTLWSAGIGAATPGPLLLDDHRGRVDAWPAVTLLADPSHEWGLADVLRRSAEFKVPDVPHANLGVRREAVWLRVPLQVQSSGRWVVEVDYPPLNRVDVHVLMDGRPVSAHWLGNELPFDRRPVKSRAHALSLDLDAAHGYELLLRVQSQSSMLVPIEFHPGDDYLQHESTHQLLQGLLLGVTLGLLIYSVANAVSLRDPLFAQYALMLGGVGLYFVSFTGLGQQHLWNEQVGLRALLAPLAVLLAEATGSLFVIGALETTIRHPRVTLGLRAIAVVAGLTAAAAVSGLLDYRSIQAVATALGPAPMLLAVHTAIIHARHGSRAARMMLVGWGAYLVGALAMVGLLRGLVPVNFWTQHLFQFASLVEMVAWLRVLSLRIEDMQRDAERGEIERDALHSMAHTDPLTGLPNRRGLAQSLASALMQVRPDNGLAVYLLDLDGFKPVNDRLGHDAGDSLLVQVSHRLRNLVRGGDVVARLGGDEFVVVGTGMRRDADAVALGQKLLDAFRQPFDVAGQRCSVGLTIGYALAPQDGSDAATLIKQADAAMYAGKEAGRHCMRRAGPALAIASSA